MAKEPTSLYSAKQLVKELNVSDKYLRRLLTNLSKSGFIRSIQGRDGGYTFQKNINDIFISDIIDSVEGMDNLSDCLLGFEKCSCTNPCAMHYNWHLFRDGLDKLFRETKLSDMDFDKIMRF
jgi:Rrf2 family protein